MQIEVESPDGVARQNEPVTCGIPWPRGALADVSQLSLFDQEGKAVSLQARVLDNWPDGSVRWALLDWQAVVDATTTYRVEIASRPHRQVDSPEIQVRQEGPALTLDTGVACFVIRLGGRFPFDSATVAGQPAIDPGRTHFTVEDNREHIFQPGIDELEIVEHGPLRMVIRVKGSLGRTARRTWCLFSAHLHFFAGLGVVRLDLTLHNPRRARHPGNFWSLGDAGSIYIRDASLTLALPHKSAPSRIQFSPEPSIPFQKLPGCLARRGLCKVRSSRTTPSPAKK